MRRVWLVRQLQQAAPRIYLFNLNFEKAESAV